jgi:phage tail-like protein
MATAKTYIECSNFSFSAGGGAEVPVLEFSNLGMDAPPTPHAAGAEKGGKKVYQPKPSPVKPQNPTIVLGGCEDKSVYEWYVKVNPGLGAGDWKAQLKDAKVTAYGDSGAVVMEWQIKQCYPSKYSVSSLTVEGGQLIKETIELVAQEIVREK